MKVTQTIINLNKLYLDDFNPRLPTSYHGKSEENIIEYLLLEAWTLELMQAIGENDFFPGEQLLVVKVNEKYKVIEGNRRLTAVKLLNDFSIATVKKNIVRQIYDEAKYRPQEIPCLVFDEEEEIHKYLGYRHITGIKSWNLNEKAKYLHSMQENEIQTDLFDDMCRNIAKRIGSRRDYVKRVIIAYEIYLIIQDEAFYKIRDLDDTKFYIGYYSDSLKQINILSFLKIDMDENEPLKNLSKINLEYLTRWFYEQYEDNGRRRTKLKGTGKELNNLNAILGSERSKNVFIKENATIEKALEYTKDINESFNNSVHNAIHELKYADDISYLVTDFYQGLVQDLMHVKKLTSNIENTMNLKKTKEI